MRPNTFHRSRAVAEREKVMGRLVPWLVFFLLLAMAGTSRAANVSGVSASPNPFTPPTTTTISYSLTNSALLWIRIYDGSSVLQRNLVTPGSYTTTNKTAGANNDVWDGKDNSAVTLPNGNYPYRIDNVYFSAHYSGVGSNPHDVAVNPANTQIIWQLNKTSPYVYKTTNGGTSWSGVFSTGADAKAYGIAIDSTGNKIYIADNGQSSLRKSTDGGTNWAASGIFPGSVTSVNDVATDSTGNTVYAVDYSGNKVYKSTNGGTNWSTCTATGLSLGTTASGIATDSAGTTVIVADSGNDRLFKSTDSCATFSQIAAITSGTAAGQVSYPYQVSMQSDGSFWVSEINNHRIQLFDSNGNSLMVVGGTAFGTGNYQFDAGTKFGIGLGDISSQPHIFVADYNNTRVKKLGYDNWTSTTDITLGPDTTPPSNPTGFAATAGDQALNLTWTNPTEPDFAGVKIVRATGATAPADCSGTAVYTGSGTSYNDTGLSNGIQYSYRICAYDGVPNYSGGSTVSGTPEAVAGLLVYGESTTSTPMFRTYMSTAGFSAQAAANANGAGSVKHSRVIESPNASEFFVGNDMSDGFIYIQKYSGGSWANQWNTSVNINSGTYRHFDIAYEQTSGEALAVYENASGGNRVIGYRTYTGGAWSTEQTLDYSALGGPSFNSVRFVKLVPKRNSDQILVMFMDNQAYVYAYIWNGTGFVNGSKITTNRLCSNAGYECFTGAWETTSGTAMVMFNDTASQISYSVFNGASWSADTGGPTLTASSYFLAADADPTSDRVAVTAYDSTNFKANFAMWDGTAWEAGAPVAISGTNVSGGMPVGVAWQKAGGVALYIWGGSDAFVHYLTYTNGTGWSSSASTITQWSGAPVKTVAISAAPNSGEKRIAVTAIDNWSDIRTIIWNDGAWSEPTNFYYEINSSSVTTQPVMFFWTTTNDTTPPAEVTGFSVQPTGLGSSLDLSWTNPGDADFAGVKIVRANGATAPADCSGTAVYNGSGIAYTDTGLTPGAQYSYRICSYDLVNNYSSGSTGSATTTDMSPPANVSGFTVGDYGTGDKVSLSWTNPGDADFAGVKIVRATGATAPADCATGTLVYNSNGTSYIDTGLTNGQTYAYRACSYDTSNNLAVGVTGSATTSDATPPANVTSLYASAGDTQITLTWTNPSDPDLAGAKILRRTDQNPVSCSDGAATMVFNGAGASYTDSGLTNGTIYYYRVCSYDAIPNYASGVTISRMSGTVDGVVIYGESTLTTPMFRTYTNAGGFSAQGTANANGAGYVKTSRIYESPTSSEYHLGNLMSDGMIYVQKYDGISWTSQWNTTASAGNYPYYDIAYEQQSGHAVAFYENSGTGDTMIKFRTYDGSSWSAEQNYDYSLLGGPLYNVVRMVKLVPKRNSNQILVLIMDNQGYIYGYIWNGTELTNGALITTNRLAGTTLYESFTGAWDSISGNALVVFNDTAGQISYATFNGTSWSADAGGPTLTGTGYFIWADADPTSDRVAVISSDVNKNANFAMWDGTAWEAGAPAAIAHTNIAGGMPVAVAWQQSGGKALFIWGGSDAYVHYLTYTNGTGWSGQASTPTAWSGAPVKTVSISASRNSGEKRIAVSGVDNWNDVRTIMWNDGAWSEPTNFYYEQTVSTVVGQPVMFAWNLVADITPPGNVAGFTVQNPGVGDTLNLSWTNPVDVDFMGVKIVKATGGVAPTDCTGTAIYSGSGTSFSDTGLTLATQYSYRICSYDYSNNYSSGSTGSGTPTDTTAPANVTSFSVTDYSTGGKLNLLWNNPVSDFAGVKIVRAAGSTAPANCSTGTVVYNSTGTDYLDTGLTNGTAYSYRACSYDASGNYAAGVTGTATPTDSTAPGNVTNLTATSASTQVTLSWTNPADADFAGVKIVRRTDQTPSSCSDPSAAAVYTGPGTSHVDTGLTNGTTYYYLVCAYDGTPNYSSGIAASATPGSDLIAPAAVSNLSQGSNVYTRAASLTFTAPGDDDTTGTASVYDVRFTDAVDYAANITSAYMDTNWASLTQANGEPSPQAAGSTELFTVTADTGGAYLKPNTQYYFAMKSTDDYANISGISNVLSVHTALKYGYNMVSIPYKTSTGGANTLNDLMGDDVASVMIYKWTSYGLDSGGYFNGNWDPVDSSTAITSLSDGAGLYMYAFSMNSSVLDEKNGAGSAIMTANSDNWAKMDLAVGRNLIGNPYLKNVDFNNVKICKGTTVFSTATGCTDGTVVSFAQAVANGWMDATISYYGNSTTFTNETCNGISCTAKLRPWWGQWVYLLINDATYIMAVPKP